MTWGIDEERKHAFQKKPGQTVDRPVTARARLNAVKVDYFIYILSSPSFLQDVASWPKTLKLLYLVESSWKFVWRDQKIEHEKSMQIFECIVLSFSISEDPYPPPQRNAPKTGLPLHPQSRTPSWQWRPWSQSFQKHSSGPTTLASSTAHSCDCPSQALASG